MSLWPEQTAVAAENSLLNRMRKEPLTSLTPTRKPDHLIGI
jgi:hypothetical protein